MQIEAASEINMVILIFHEWTHLVRNTVTNWIVLHKFCAQAVTSAPHQRVCWGCLHRSDIDKQIISDVPSRHRRDRVAGCPSYVAGLRGVPRLVGSAAVTHRMGKWQGQWLRGVASGSSLSFLARWKGRDGEPSLSVHWSRASPPLATIRVKGQLSRRTGPGCASYTVTHSHTRGVTPCHSGLAAPHDWWPHEDDHPSQNNYPPPRRMDSTWMNFLLIPCPPHYALLVLLKILPSPGKLKQPSF